MSSQGDITKLEVNAIVNAANTSLLGVYAANFCVSPPGISTSDCFTH